MEGRGQQGRGQGGRASEGESEVSENVAGACYARVGKLGTGGGEGEERPVQD